MRRSRSYNKYASGKNKAELEQEYRECQKHRPSLSPKVQQILAITAMTHIICAASQQERRRESYND